MNQFFSWLSMGGYSLYVWPAYGLVAVVLGMNVLGLRLHRSKITQKLRLWFSP